MTGIPKEILRAEPVLVMISARITQEDKEFLDKHKISASKFLRYKIKEFRELIEQYDKTNNKS
jgi:hypothetical protein